ncbi:hypothetical protein KKB18_08875 [bacterium]|nr:hypothetical protein [bacterium]
MDGLTRAGKAMMQMILASFEGLEIGRIEAILDRIPILYHFNKMEKDAAVSILRHEIQEMHYQSMISRKINFRVTDDTGVLRNPQSWRYFKRLFQPESDVALARMKKENSLFQAMTHDILGMVDIYFEAFGQGLYIIEMIRHPIDLIHTNYVRGYGQREEEDPKCFSFTIHYQGHLLPWFCAGWEEEYLASNQVDKVIKATAHRMEQVNKGYDNLTPEQQKQILFIPYEKFMLDPWKYLKQVEAFIGRKTTRSTKTMLKKKKLPDYSREHLREKRAAKIRELASLEGIALMEKITREYEERFSAI